MKFELSDDTVLKVSSLAAASFGAHSWAAPEHYIQIGAYYVNLIIRHETPQ